MQMRITMILVQILMMAHVTMGVKPIRLLWLLMVVHIKLKFLGNFQALQVVRGLSGVHIVGADMVEVSPPFDAAGGTAYLGVSIMFELLCQMVSSHSPKI